MEICFQADILILITLHDGYRKNSFYEHSYWRRILRVREFEEKVCCAKFYDKKRHTEKAHEHYSRHSGTDVYNAQKNKLFDAYNAASDGVEDHLPNAVLVDSILDGLPPSYQHVIDHVRQYDIKM